MSWTIEVPMVPGSLNPRLRTHWAKARREKQAWLEALFYLFANHKIPAPKAKRLVTITRRAYGRLDRDNLVPAYKEVVVDNLKPAKLEQCTYRRGPKKGQRYERRRGGLGLIVEDDPDWVEVVYLQERVGRNEPQVTIITIEET